MLAEMGNATQCPTSLALQPTVRWPPKDGQPALTVRGRRILAFARAPLLKCRAQPCRQMLMRIGPRSSHASRWYSCAPTFEVSRARRPQAGVRRLDRMVRPRKSSLSLRLRWGGHRVEGPRNATCRSIHRRTAQLPGCRASQDGPPPRCGSEA